MTIRRTSGTYASLQLAENPFIPVPPIGRYETEFRDRFSARSAEVDSVCRYASGARAIFVVAPYGGGKTVVLLEALSRLRRAHSTVVYSSFQQHKGFRSSLLEGMTLAGVDVNASASDVFLQIRTAVRRLTQTGQSVVLAIDDLDRASELPEVFHATHDIRDVLSDGAAIVVAGQPFGVTNDLYTSAGGIFHPVVLPAFSVDDFREMLVKYLTAVHTTPGLVSTHPFDDDGAEFVCSEIAKHGLTPRLFNFAVSELIDLAAAQGCTTISMDVVLKSWPAVAERTLKGLSSLQSHHVAVILKEHIVSEDTPRAIEKLGGSVLAEFPQVQDEVLRPLVEKNVVYVQKVAGKDEYRLTPHAAAMISDLVRTPLPYNDRDGLHAKWLACRAAAASENGDDLLHQFVVEFLSSVPGFRVPPEAVRSRPDSEGLDMTIEVDGYHHHVRYGTLAICTCRNSPSPVTEDALTTFRDTLKYRSCRFGVFIAVGGVTSAFRDKIRTYLRDGLVIALLTTDEFSRLQQGIDPEAILRDAYYAAFRSGAADVPPEAAHADSPDRLSSGRHTDVLLVTVTPYETQALLEVFARATGKQAMPVTVEDRLYRDLGTVNGTRFLHALSEMGSGGLGATQQTVEKAIRAVRPGAVIAVGIAFGINEKKQSIGDILISKQLRLYDLQRVGDQIVLRGDKSHASGWLINFFEGIAQTSWKGSIVRTGVVLTGDKLVDNQDYRDQLTTLEPEAIGGEMEGAGLYVACDDQKVDWIVIKAICDWGDGHKAKNKKARQQKAARIAAEFILHAVQHAPLKKQ